MTFLVALLECLRGSRRSEILITIRQRLICLPPPVKKSNNYIIQPSYTTDAQKCDKTLLRKRNQVLRSLYWILLTLRAPQIARVPGRKRTKKIERKPLCLHNIQIGGITWNDNNLSSRKVENIAQIVFGSDNLS